MFVGLMKHLCVKYITFIDFCVFNRCYQVSIDKPTHRLRSSESTRRWLLDKTVLTNN